MIEYVSRLPAGYQEVEYIQSSGTQHIDMGVKGGSGVRLKIKAQLTSVSNHAVLFGARASDANTAFLAYYNNSSNEWDFDYNKTANRQHVSSSVIPKTEVIEIDANNNVWTVNGTTLTFPAATFETPYNMALFALNHGGTINYHINGKIFYCQIYKNGTLLRDYIPCYRISDGVAGMYDLVNSVFYTAAGSGAFTKGADVDGGIAVTPGGIIPQKYALRRRMMVSGGGLFPSAGTPLEGWTWGQIIALANSGKDATQYFDVGDEKTITLTTGEVVTAVIGDFYHNTITGTSKKAAIAFTFKNCLNTAYAMNSSSTNSGGWDGSNMRKTHMVNILNTFPAELRADGAIKYVDVVATAGLQSTSLVTSSDRLRLHSITELGLTHFYAGTEGTTYAYYASGNRVKTVGGTANYYWTRSPSIDYSAGFCYVASSGSAFDHVSNTAFGVACGFDI